MAQYEQWAGFKGRNWTHSVDVRSFIQDNYTPYEGDDSFLEGPTEATNKLWGRLQELQKEERAKGGVLDMETDIVSGLTAYGPGYIDESMKDLEQVVGLRQTSLLREHSCLTVELRWQSRLVQLMDMSQIQNFMKSLLNIIKHTIREFSISIHQR